MQLSACLAQRHFLFPWLLVNKEIYIWSKGAGKDDFRVLGPKWKIYIIHIPLSSLGSGNIMEEEVESMQELSLR